MMLTWNSSLRWGKTDQMENMVGNQERENSEKMWGNIYVVIEWWQVQQAKEKEVNMENIQNTRNSGRKEVSRWVFKHKILTSNA